jgi:alkyl sulfatase BDS1-like metallo-beta-lactamase superfamily hydrolase
METELFLDYLGVRLNGTSAGDRAITLGLSLPDIRESWTLMIRNGALSHRRGDSAEVDARVTIARADLDAVILGAAPLTDQIADGRAKIGGDERALHDFVSPLDEFEFWFNIVTP